MIGMDLWREHHVRGDTTNHGRREGGVRKSTEKRRWETEALHGGGASNGAAEAMFHRHVRKPEQVRNQERARVW